MKPHINDNIAFPIPAQQRPKLSGMEFYTKTLGAPKLVVRFTIILCLQFLYFHFSLFAFCIVFFGDGLRLPFADAFYRFFIFAQNELYVQGILKCDKKLKLCECEFWPKIFRMWSVLKGLQLSRAQTFRNLSASTTSVVST